MSIYSRILLISFVLIPVVCGQSIPTDRLEHARAVNLQRLAGLPDFVADELVTRYKSSHTNPPKWRYVDTIEAEIAVRGSSFTRQHVRLNGKSWDKPTFPGFNWGIQFGHEIKPLFNPECGTTFEFDGHKEVRGKQLLAYRYQSPKDDCFATYTIDKNQYNPPRTGRLLIDLTGNIIQFEEEVGEFPKGFGADPFRQTITSDYVKVGTGSYLLPVAADIFGGFSGGFLWHVVVEYRNHRHFEASTNVTFQE